MKRRRAPSPPTGSATIVTSSVSGVSNWSFVLVGAATAITVAGCAGTDGAAPAATTIADRIVDTDADRVVFVTTASTITTSTTTTTAAPPTTALPPSTTRPPSTTAATTAPPTTLGPTTTAEATTTTIAPPTSTATTITCSFAADALFEPGDAVLNDDAVVELADLVVDPAQVRSVRIVGYTDHRGSAATNLVLSQQRAAAAAAVLVGAGISPAVVTAVGVGERFATQPTGGSSPDAAALAVDRRVEIVLAADVTLSTPC